jgi:hypothetical protein
MEEIMKSILVLLAVLSAGVAVCAHADTKSRYQSATVVSVDTHQTPSTYIGTATDAPLQTEVYSYDIGIRLNCTVYTVRYDSGLDTLPSLFTPNHEIEVSLQKRSMNIAFPGERSLKLGIAGRGRMKDTSCMASK